MLERGDASAEDIDQAMQLGAGYRKHCLAVFLGILTRSAMGVSVQSTFA